MNLQLRPITFLPELFEPLVAEGEAQGALFMPRLRDEWVSGATRFNREGEILFGAFIEEQLVAVGGITHDPYEPDPNLGRVRHVYVLERYRGRGIGRVLVERILEHARGRFTQLRLSTERVEAVRLYESLGFARSDAPHQTHRMRF